MATKNTTYTAISSFFILTLFLFSVFAIAACKRSITESDAIAIAKQALSGQTKFYAKIGNETKTVSNVSVGSATAYFDNTYWHVALHVQGMDDGGTLRQNDVEVLVNPDGSVAGMGAGKSKPLVSNGSDFPTPPSSASPAATQ